jgi:hypothetical protein
MDGNNSIDQLTHDLPRQLAICFSFDISSLNRSRGNRMQNQPVSGSAICLTYQTFLNVRRVEGAVEHVRLWLESLMEGVFGITS